VTDLVSGILFLAPGFLALKLFDLFGAQRRRTEWEWTTWSVIASVPISVAANWVRSWFKGQTQPPDSPEVILRIVIAVAFAAGAVYAWRRVRGSTHPRALRFRREVGSSAWDAALEDVQRSGRQVELILDDEKHYIGKVGYGGREDNEAEGWIYLIYPEVFEEATRKFRPAKGTHGYLIHRDHINRVRVLLRKYEPDPRDEPVAGSSDPEVAENR
jgi:Family of unknown function (DUF6338)